MSEERRRDVRVPTQESVRYWSNRDEREAGEDGWTSTILNISLGGAFLYKPEKLLTVGSKIHLECDFDGKVFTAEGFIVWFSDHMLQIDCYPGMAVKFENLSDEMRNVLKNFVNSHC